MSNLYTHIFSNYLFPIHERIKGQDTVAVRRRLEQTQWLDGAALEELQLQRLQRLLMHVGQYVPHYQRLFSELNFDPANVKSLQELQKLPLQDKASFRRDTQAFKSTEDRPLARMTTGGSSGEPLTFWLGKERVSHDVAAKWRATRWWDVDIGDPEIVLWGSPVELGKQDRIKQMRDVLQRSVLLPAFEMSESRVRDFIKVIRRRQPRMLFGYPSALAHIAKFAESEGTRMNDLGVRVAFVTAERLYDHQRDVIARVFGCKVANGYGGRDAGFLAHECPHGGMHITAEDVILEIVDESGRNVPTGETGELVVTHLATRDFPFIRYRTSDVGALDDRQCACGRGLPLLKEIQGRTTDFIIAQDGTVMHGLALIYVVRDVTGIRSFKIIQETLDRIQLLIVPDDSFDEGVRGSIRAGFKKRLGDKVEINIEIVADIPAEASGKFRYVVSRISAHA